MIKDAKSSLRLEAQSFPSLIKYMGSKTKIMEFVFEGINEVYRGGTICDLFSGSASLAGALGQQCAVHSNDIQNYSAVLANTYNKTYRQPSTPSAAELVSKAELIFKKNMRSLALRIDYSNGISLDDFNRAEGKQKDLINRKFRRDWHLFVKNYAGTWWSAEQCLWIDALREVADGYRSKRIYPAILSSLMFGMAYASQGTGHYAQYRDAKTESSMADILIYRRRSLVRYFTRKYDEILTGLSTKKPEHNHIATALDYKDCLDSFGGGLVYADPPYCFVHYSRFYHALETIVLYDYPPLQYLRGNMVKGRYRETRHQSPFCIQSQVRGAFKTLFQGVLKSNSNLVMSYSDTGMIAIDEVEEMALNSFRNRKVELLTTDHIHMTLGRKKDRHRNVKECLLLIS